jgi:hypothetical protein
MPSAISVNVTDTFEQWRLKTNQISIDVFDAVRNVHEDLTPSLGGDLYLNNTETGYTGSFDILGTGNINIDGSITSTGNISGAGITGTGDFTANSKFSVNAASGNVTGSNWSVDGTTGELTLGAGITGGNWSIDDATSDITATTFSGDLEGTINTATTATTQAAAVNNTTVATTEYVTTGIGNLTLTVDALSDTTISNPQEQDLLMYDSASSKWASGSITAAGVPNQAFTVAMAIALGY